MLCPVCGFDNLTGAEVCDNCGADLAGSDVPQPAMSFHGRLLGEHLDDLGAPPPLTVSPDTPVDVVIGRRQTPIVSWSWSTIASSASSPTAMHW